MTKFNLIFLLIFSLTTHGAFGFFLDIQNIGKMLENLVNLKIDVLQILQDINNYANEEVHDRTPPTDEVYDFIVVGAGSAGATIAARLSEVEKASVLLIEAGGHENLLMDIPILAMHLQFATDIHWNFRSEPSNQYCRAFKNNQCRASFGKVMGGSSVMNFMMATRGFQRDYNEWANLTGDNSWSFDNMLQYFKKLENFDIKGKNVREEYHNHDGPVRITHIPYPSPLANAFVTAGTEMGYPNIDYNGPHHTGFSFLQTNQIHGERLSANRAYLHPARNRNNLVVSMYSHVTKVLIDPKSKTAYGVRFIKGNRIHQVRARKEVILSAGAVGSSKILMLSGIGPADHLQSLKINVLKDAPVGQNLMDHTAFGGLVYLVNQSIGITLPHIIQPTNGFLKDYLNYRTGPLAVPGGIEGIAFVNVDSPPGSAEPEIEFFFGSSHFGTDDLLQQAFEITDRNWLSSFDKIVYRHGWLLWPVLLRPKSRGQILLRSSNPLDSPRLIPNYFSHPDDVRLMIKGIRKALEVGNTQAMKKYGSKLHNYVIPSCKQYRPNSDDYWECAIRTYTVSIWHYTGTCKMGRKDDPTAVVNSKLQVKGFKHLRVVDGSIMPTIVSGHPNIPIIAIAEKFADDLKAHWKYI